MIKSMTGYGRAQQTIDGREITVEIKSVNHRFFEFSARTPRAYGYLESKLKSYMQSSISRGKIDVGVTIFTLEGVDANVEINHAMVKSYVDALRGIRDEFSLRDDLSLSSISRFPDVFTVCKTQEDESVIWDSVKIVLDQAILNFVHMRQAEGERMKKDIEGRLDTIADHVCVIEQRSPQTVSEYRARLTAKMQEVLQDTKVDEQRILTEAAIYSERIAVDEETVRLRSHIKQFHSILQSEEPIGRKLDFLVQELNREANTIGSKAQDLEIAGIVVEIKSEIEKIREQIQNIE